MSNAIPTTAEELAEALRGAENDEKAAHARVVVLRDCLRSRKRLDAQAAEADANLLARIAAAGSTK